MEKLLIQMDVVNPVFAGMEFELVGSRSEQCYL